MDSWKEKVQNIMTKNIKACEFYENAHNDHIIFYEKIIFFGILMGTIIVFLNTILSTLVTSGIGNAITLNIIIAIMSGITGSVGIYITHYDPVGKMSSHVNLKNKYRTIINKIEWEQVFNDKSDDEIDEFVKTICKEMLELEANNTSTFIFDKRLLNKQRVLKSLKRSGSSSSENGQENNNSDVESGINGLSEQESHDFDILFSNPNMMQYQLQRLNR